MEPNETREIEPSGDGVAPRRRLRRELGLGMATVLVIGKMVGSGISSWAIWGAGYEAVTKGVILMLAGVPILLYVK